MSRARELGRFAGTITTSGDLSFDDGTGIFDSNSNEMLLFRETASAVNYLELKNNTAGSAPFISAAGSDTNISVVLEGKGSGSVYLRPESGNTVGQLIVSKTDITWNGSLVARESRAMNWTAEHTWTGGSQIMSSAANSVLSMVDSSAGRTQNPSIRFSTSGGAAGVGDYTAAGTLIDNVNSLTSGYFRIIRYDAINVARTGVLFKESGVIDFITTITTKSMTVNGNVIHTDADEGGWIAPTLVNSWVNYGTGGWANAGYRKAADGRIDIRGLIKNGSPVNSIVFTLPVGYRPLDGNVMFATSGGSGVIRLDVSTSGVVSFQAGGSSTFSSITCSFYP